MIASKPISFLAFDISKPVGKYQTRLPHWQQDGVTYFVTFRLSDSIPKCEFDRWEREKSKWLKERGLLGKEDPEFEKSRFEFEKKFNRKLNGFLDGCQGLCLLRNLKNRRIIEQRFEAVDCTIGSYVIMPNHVHVLVTPGHGQIKLAEAMRFIKGGSARLINDRESRSGKLWQKDNFDHIVRSVKSLEKFQQYIETNPKAAGLSYSDYSYYRAEYSAT